MTINFQKAKYSCVALIISAIQSLISLNVVAQQVTDNAQDNFKLRAWYSKGSNNLIFSPNTIVSIAPKNSNQTNIFRLGSDFDYSHFILKNLSIGIGFHYSHLFQNAHDANVYKFKLFIEYFILRKSKFSPYFGMRVQNTNYQYYTDNPSNLYFNDSLTFSKKTHSYISNTFYLGLDWKISTRIAIGLNTGTGFLYVPKNTNGIVPDLTPWTIYPTFKWKIN